MDSAAIPWLVFFLGPRLGLAWVPRDLEDIFTGDDEIFSCVTDDIEALNQFPAFYDRLHDPAGRLVGIQVTPLVWSDLPLVVGTLPFVRTVNNGKQLQIFFAPIPAQVIDSGDQAFGGRIYRSDTGEVAISCDTYFLENGEREMIDQGTLARVTVGPAAKGQGNAP